MPFFCNNHAHKKSCNTKILETIIVKACKLKQCFKKCYSCCMVSDINMCVFNYVEIIIYVIPTSNLQLVCEINHNSNLLSKLTNFLCLYVKLIIIGCFKY